MKILYRKVEIQGRGMPTKSASGKRIRSGMRMRIWSCFLMDLDHLVDHVYLHILSTALHSCTHYVLLEGMEEDWRFGMVDSFNCLPLFEYLGCVWRSSHYLL